MPEHDQSDEHTLTETYETINQLSDSIRRLDAQVDEARRVAHLLDNELSELRGVIDPVAAQHTPSAWVGRSATTSRRRLDTHSAECSAAIRSIDRVIDELHAHASHSVARSESTRNALEGARRRAISLEFDLGRFDDVAI